MEKRIRIIVALAVTILAGCAVIWGCIRINSETEMMTTEQRYYMPDSTYYYTDYEEYLQAIAEREAYSESETAEETSTAIEETETDALATSEEAYLLAKLAMVEAEGEDIKGKALVICVVLNRVKSASFPDTIEEVIYAENQFATTGSRWESLEPDDDCYAAVEIVFDGWDESQGALYFESSDADEDSWHNTALTYLFTYGGHRFYE